MQCNNNGSNYISNEGIGAKLFDGSENYECIFCANQILGSSVVSHLRTHFNGLDNEKCKQSGDKYLLMALEDTWLQSVGCNNLNRWCYYDPFCKFGIPWENPIPLSSDEMDQGQIDPRVKDELMETETEQAPAFASSDISGHPSQLPSLVSPVPVPTSIVSANNYSSTPTPNDAATYHSQLGTNSSDSLPLVQNLANNTTGSTSPQHEKHPFDEPDERPSVPTPTRKVVIIGGDNDESLPDASANTELAPTTPERPLSYEFGSPAPNTPNSMSHDLSAVEKEQECRNRLEEAARAKREELGKAGHPPPKPAKCMVGRDECMDPNKECGNLFVPCVAHFAHVNTVHLKLPLYRCKAPGCGQEFTGSNTGGILKHIKSQHGKKLMLKDRVKLIQCLDANKQTVQKSLKKFFPFSAAAGIEDSG